MIRITELFGAGDTSRDLTVTESGSKLTVSAGTFKIGKKDYELSEDEEWEITPRPFDVFVRGVLVSDSGEVRLLVIESAPELPEFFWPDHPELDGLDGVFSFMLPANTASLESVAVEVLKVNPMNVRKAEEKAERDRLEREENEELKARFAAADAELRGDKQKRFAETEKQRAEEEARIRGLRRVRTNG